MVADQRLEVAYASGRCEVSYQKIKDELRVAASCCDSGMMRMANAHVLHAAKLGATPNDIEELFGASRKAKMRKWKEDRDAEAGA